MKQKIYFIAVLLFFSNRGFGQISEDSNTIPKEEFKFLYILKFATKESIATTNAFVAPSERDSTYSLRSAQKEVLCQLFGVDGVIVIKMKQNCRLLSLYDIFAMYHIQLKFRKNKVMVNDRIISNPETLFISQVEIESLKIAKMGEGGQIRILLRGYNKQRKNGTDDEPRKL